MTNAEPVDASTGAPDAGMRRAGAAAAARRRELDISQRSLAAEGIINAGALIAFEKGRSWPRERTRSRLEKILQWPPGTIARLRNGEPVPSSKPAPAAAPTTNNDEASLIAQAVITAVGALGSTADTLPPVDDPAFMTRTTAILADLRQLEAVASRAAACSAARCCCWAVCAAWARACSSAVWAASCAPLCLSAFSSTRTACSCGLRTSSSAGRGAVWP